MSNKTLTKDEYLNNIRNIINESMSDEPDRILKSDKFNISKHIISLIESGQNDPKLMNYLMEWHKTVKEAPEGKEFTMYESFASGLTQYAKANAAVKNVLKEMQNMLSNFGDEYLIFNLIEQLQDPIIRDAARSTYNDYLYENTQENRKEIIESIWPAYEANNPVALKLIEALSDENAIRNREIQHINEDVTHTEISERLARQREERKIKRTKQKIEEYANQVFENERIRREEEKKQYNFGTIVNNTGINLDEAIRIIVNSDAKSNKKLMAIVEQYAGALNNGLYEERLYETFLHKLSVFDYLMPVEKAIKQINEAVKKNPTGIEITKLMEEMAESTSAYILPMIEEDCARYVKNPNPNNRVQVRNCLMAYVSDPYCYKILEAIDNDNSLAANTIAEQALNVKDAIKLIREHATVTDLYSPVQYIKEGESVFYTNGQYFVRKGKTIAKLSADGISQLSEKFTTLCKLVNDPQVKIMNDHILLTASDKVARIYEGFVDINGIRESAATLRNLQEMCMKYDYDTNFFIMASCLLENFNKIAKIDFAKHIYLNENEGLNADIFRLGEQIFINTVNEDANVSTFFHNVNPLQCRNILNGHMGINVANLFENLLPNQSKIIMRLNETKEEYQNAIDKLETKIEQLEAAKEKCTDETSINKLEDGIKKAKDSLKDLKAEYKDWQKKAAEATGEAADDAEDEKEKFDDEEVNGDGEVKKETTNEPLKDEDVEKAMGDLTTPINAGDAAAAESTETGEGDDIELTDDEFEEFLTDDSDESTETEEPTDDVDFNDIADDTETVDDTEESDVTAEVEEPAEVDDTTADTEEVVATVPETEFDSAIDDEINAVLADDETDIEDDDSEISDDERIFGGDDDTEETEFNDEEVATVEDEPVETGDDDMGFDEVQLDDEEPEVEITDEEIENLEDDSDEDIITGDEATDEFGGDVNQEVVDMTDTPNQIAGIEPETELIAKITNVLFDENIKTGVKYRTGTVSAIVPMVDKTGKMYNDNQTYSFYLDPDGRPVIDNENMPYSLYDAIIKKIQAEPSYDVFNKDGVAVDEKPDTYVDVTKDVLEPEADKDDTLNFNTDIDDEIFATVDTPDKFSVTVKDDFADIPEIDFNDGDDDDDFPVKNDRTIADLVNAIPTYKDGDTEIELPAANVDDTVIPEKVVVKTSAKKINENRKAIKGIGSVLSSNKKGSRFFVNEDAAKSSESLNRYGSQLLREKISGTAEQNNGLVIEEYNPEIDNNDLTAMHAVTKTAAYAAYNQTGLMINVSDILPAFPELTEEPDFNNIYFFDISLGGSDNEQDSYTAYCINDKVYYRPTWEFNQIRLDLQDEVPGQTESNLEYEFASDEPLTSVHNIRMTVYAIISSLVGESVSLNEHAKIRKNKLSTDHDIMNSKAVDDILHGDKEQRDFEEKVEKDTQAAGVENPLAPSAPAQEESVKPMLPNVHRMSLDEARNFEIIYEPNDHVLYQNEKGEVIEIHEDGKVSVKMDDKTVVAEPKDLEPDPDYVNDLEVVDSEDPKPSLNKSDNDNLNDLNKKTIDCNIVVDGHRVNMHECAAILDDIVNGKSQIRVINENGETSEYAIDNIEFPEWPYAVIVNSEGEPLRKIQINPQSYINAGEDDYVECLVAGKQSRYLKRVINVLS